MTITNLVVKRERKKKNIILLALDSQINHKYRQNDHFENTIKFEHKEVNQSGQRLASTKVGGNSSNPLGGTIYYWTCVQSCAMHMST